MPAFAVDGQEAPGRTAPVALSGFGTLGLTHTREPHGWRFARELMQRGADGPTSLSADSRLGLQLDAMLGPDWQATAQLGLRERAPDARAGEALEWATLGWRPLADLQVRLGRTSPDMFLYADTRNLGLALPWVRPPVEVYGWMPFASLDGADLTLRWPGGGADWRARLAVGRLDSTVAALWLDRSVRARARDVGTLSLTRETDGLTLKASALAARTWVDHLPQTQQLRDGLEALAGLPAVAATARSLIDTMEVGGQTRYLALGAQLDRGSWQWQAEWSRVSLQQGSPAGRRAYLGVGHRVGPLTVHALLARSRPSRALPGAPGLGAALEPLVGPVQAAQAQALAEGAIMTARLSRFDQRTVSLGLRWDLRGDSALKFQIDRVKVAADGAGAWRHGSPQAGRATVGTVVFDFTWGQG